MRSSVRSAISICRRLGAVASVAVVATSLSGCKASQAPPAQESRDLSRFRDGGTAYVYRSAIPGFSEAKIPGLAVRFAVTRVQGRSIYSDAEAEGIRRTYGPQLARAGYEILIVHTQVSQPGGVITVTKEYEGTESVQFAAPGSDEPIIADVVNGHGI